MATKEVTGGLSTDPSDLDKQPDVEDELSLGELFWDKLVLFLATFIAALTAVDILTELLRGETAVVCYVPEELNATESQDSFIQNFCSRSVPDTQYLPMFVLVHGVMIGVVHYIWKSSFSSQFHYFFSLAKTLARVRDEKTGDFPPHNANIVRRLQVEFSAYSHRYVFTWYQIKLLFQMIVAVISLFISFFIFDNFEVEFKCPRSNLETSIWPYPGETVNCIFASLRLFWLVRVIDLILLFLIIVCLLWGLLWSFLRHPKELSAKNAALFSFTTGLDSSYYVPKSVLTNLRSFFSSFKEIRLRLFVPRITTDLDFFRMLLYRTDSGLAHSFWEGEVEIERGALRELDHQLIFAHDVIDKGKFKSEDEIIAHITTGWSIPDGSKTLFKAIASRLSSQNLFIPDKIRGAVMGLGLRSPDNLLAVDLCFGSYTSLGFSSALIRIFDRVGCVNFDPSYQDDEKTTVRTVYSNAVYGYRCYEDVVTKATQDRDFKVKTCDLWREKTNGLSTNDRRIDFMVIGPIAELRHIGTAKYLIDHWRSNYRRGSILVVLQPEKIEGENGVEQFYNFVPPKALFEEFDPKVKTKTGETLDWPITDPEEPPQVVDGAVLSFKCGTSSCQFCVRSYRCIVEPNPLEESEEETSDYEESGEESQTDEITRQKTALGQKKAGQDDTASVQSEEASSGDSVPPTKMKSAKATPVGISGLLPKTTNVAIEMEEGRLKDSGKGTEAAAIFFTEMGEAKEREEEEEEVVRDERMEETQSLV